jgi:hypothetical protein
MADPVDSKASEQPDKKQSVSDSEIDAAYQDLIKGEGSPAESEKVETKVEGEVKLDVQPTIPEDQAERTRLGRRVKKVEESLDTILHKLDQIGQVRMPSQQQVDTTDSGELPEFVSTPADVERVLDVRDRKRQSAIELYQTNYAKAIGKMENEIEDPKLAEEVITEIFSNPQAFNKILSENPSFDAEVNFNKAMASVLRKKLAVPLKPKPNVKGETPIAPTGTTVGSTSKGAVEAPIELDEFAKEFVKATGMSPESVKTALSGEIPLGLVRGK